MLFWLGRAGWGRSTQRLDLPDLRTHRLSQRLTSVGTAYPHVSFSYVTGRFGRGCSYCTYHRNCLNISTRTDRRYPIFKPTEQSYCTRAVRGNMITVFRIPRAPLGSSRALGLASISIVEARMFPRGAAREGWTASVPA